MQVKFLYNGIKVDGKLYKAWYSLGKYRNYPEGTITIYARDYESFPKIDGLNIENNTDLMTDYFENDRIRVTPDNKWYPQVLEAYNKQQAKRAKRGQKREGCRIIRDKENDNMKHILAQRIERLKEIANDQGVTASIKMLGGRIYANINGQSFVVHGEAQFKQMCRELKNYMPPEPINLTERLERIENAFIKRI